MDCSKVGSLILRLRKEKNITQKEVADRMSISDKTISKWERGMGCPDVTLLRDLSGILGVNIESILMGDLEESDKDGGNMKRIRFYVCKNCSNAISSTSDDEYYITMEHPMDKSHYVSFAAFVGFDKMMLIKFYPEQNLEMRIPKMQRGKLYICCSEHGLWVKGI